MSSGSSPPRLSILISRDGNDQEGKVVYAVTTAITAKAASDLSLATCREVAEILPSRSWNQMENACSDALHLPGMVRVWATAGLL